MTLTERLAACHQSSVALYLRRQEVETQRQQLQRQATLIDQNLVELDGQISLLNELVAAEPKG